MQSLIHPPANRGCEAACDPQPDRMCAVLLLANAAALVVVMAATGTCRASAVLRLVTALS